MAWLAGRRSRDAALVLQIDDAGPGPVIDRTAEGTIEVAAAGSWHGTGSGTALHGLASGFQRGGLAGLSGVAGDWSAVVVERRDSGGDVVLARGGRGAFPIYIGVSSRGHEFASALPALLADDAVPRAVDAERVLGYLRGLPAGDPEATLLRGVRRVPAGHGLVLDGVLDGAPPGAPDRLRTVPLGRPSGAGSPGRSPAAPAAPPTAVEALAALPEAVRLAEEPFPDVRDLLRRQRVWEAGDPAELLGRWLRARRAQVQGIFRSPSFCSRPYWDGLAVADAFLRACARPAASVLPFWRALNLELWLRAFVDRPRARLLLPMTEAESTALGDRDLRQAVPAAAPHPGRHLAMVARDRGPYLRIPVRTRNVWPGDKLTDVVDEGLASCKVALRAGDVLVVAEKIVAIGQGRVVRPEDVEVRRLARVLARYTLRTPAGISLGMPESFELAVREAGVVRILAGAAAAAITRPFGIRGLFYRFAGWKVAAIDSPDADALPPSDRCIKLAPDDPDGAARRLADHVSSRVGARVEAAVVDVNDIGAEVLGASPGVDRRLLVSVLRDNPLGQDVQQTPLGIVRAADAGNGR